MTRPAEPDGGSASEESGGDGEVTSINAIATTEATSERLRERTREKVTYVLVGLAALLMLGIFVLVGVRRITTDDALKLLGALSPIVSAPLGVAVAFYFVDPRNPARQGGASRHGTQRQE